MLVAATRQVKLPIALDAHGDLQHASPAPLAWATWSKTVALIGVLVAIRIVYLIWLSPWELVGDEGYYWEQSRHLELCYNEKGAALAWIIAACCRVFGNTEWAVRLPVVAAFAVAAWGLGRLALSVSRGDQRVAFFSVAGFCLIPAFQANAQICTQDGPLIAIWIGLTAIGLRFFRRWRADQTTWQESLLLWFVLGVGFHFKQSILLFLPSLALYWLISRRALRWRWSLVVEQLAGMALFVGIILPMIIWNARHGWPMLAHTMGHLGVGGDQTGHASPGNPLTWQLSLLSGVLFSFGPPCIFLFVSATRQARKQQDLDSLWLLCATWPSLAFFVALAFIKPVVPSWPLPSLAPLLIPVAMLLVSELPRYRRAWNWLIVYGVVGWLIFSFPQPLGWIPFRVGERIKHATMGRIIGHRADAQRLQLVLDKLAADHPIIVTRHYMPAGLYSFYLRDHPNVCTAGKYLGKRSTNFDHWQDTDLANPALYGRTLVLDGDGGKDGVPWEKALIFDSRIPLDDHYWLATNYQGPRPDHPVFGNSEESEP